jgi:hypothetical protein
MAPGKVYEVDAVKEFRGDLIRRLQAEPSQTSLEALKLIHAATSEGWLAAIIEEVSIALLANRWSPMRPADLLHVLNDPDRRVVTSEAQLAEVVLEALDAISRDISADSARRALFWHRQRVPERPRTWIPNEENEFSNTLAIMLDEKLKTLVVRREVQAQPRLGGQAGDNPDIEVTAKLDDGSETRCPIEVKGNWHDDVNTAIETQLAKRYLTGPGGHTGIYLVAWYGGAAWSRDDSRQAKAGRHQLQALTDELHAKAKALSKDGTTVHVCVVDLTLERDAT